jgi:hypothetical protein
MGLANDPTNYPLSNLIIFSWQRKENQGPKKDPDPFRLLQHPLSLAHDLSIYGSFLKPFSEDL